MLRPDQPPPRKHSASMKAYWACMRRVAAKRGITVREARKLYKASRAKLTLLTEKQRRTFK